MDLGWPYFPFTCEENIHSQIPTTFEIFFTTYFDCGDYSKDFLWTAHLKVSQVNFVDACPACVDFAVITFLSTYFVRAGTPGPLLGYFYFSPGYFARILNKDYSTMERLVKQYLYFIINIFLNQRILFLCYWVLIVICTTFCIPVADLEFVTRCNQATENTLIGTPCGRHYCAFQ